MSHLSREERSAMTKMAARLVDYELTPHPLWLCKSPWHLLHMWARLGLTMEEHPVLLKNALRAAAKEAFEDPTAMKEHLEEIPDPFAPNVENPNGRRDTGDSRTRPNVLPCFGGHLRRPRLRNRTPSGL